MHLRPFGPPRGTCAGNADGDARQGIPVKRGGCHACPPHCTHCTDERAVSPPLASTRERPSSTPGLRRRLRRAALPREFGEEGDPKGEAHAGGEYGMPPAGVFGQRRSRGYRIGDTRSGLGRNRKEARCGRADAGRSELWRDGLQGAGAETDITVVQAALSVPMGCKHHISLGFRGLAR